MTPLHLAARAGHVNTVKCLVEQGADINVQGHNFGVSDESTLLNYCRNFAKPHIGNGCGHFALVNIANMYLLHSFHGEGAWSFCAFLCTICLLFIFLVLNCAHLDALQYWLGYICKCEASAHKSTWYITRTKQLCTSPMICSIPYAATTFKTRRQQLTGHLNGQHWDQYSRWRHRTTFWANGPHTMHHMCSYTCTKGFQLWTLTFQKRKGAIIYFHVEENKLGNS